MEWCCVSNVIKKKKNFSKKVSHFLKSFGAGIKLFSETENFSRLNYSPCNLSLTTKNIIKSQILIILSNYSQGAQHINFWPSYYFVPCKATSNIPMEVWSLTVDLHSFNLQFICWEYHALR